MESFLKSVLINFGGHTSKSKWQCCPHFDTHAWLYPCTCILQTWKENKRKYLMIMMITKQIFSEQSKNISVLLGAMFPAAVTVSFCNIFFFSFFNYSCWLVFHKSKFKHYNMYASVNTFTCFQKFDSWCCNNLTWNNRCNFQGKINSRPPWRRHLGSGVELHCSFCAAGTADKAAYSAAQRITRDASLTVTASEPLQPYTCSSGWWGRSQPGVQDRRRPREEVRLGKESLSSFVTTSMNSFVVRSTDLFWSGSKSAHDRRLGEVDRGMLLVLPAWQDSVWCVDVVMGQ